MWMEGHTASVLRQGRCGAYCASTVCAHTFIIGANSTAELVPSAARRSFGTVTPADARTRSARPARPAGWQAQRCRHDVLKSMMMRDCMGIGVGDGVHPCTPVRSLQLTSSSSLAATTSHRCASPDMNLQAPGAQTPSTSLIYTQTPTRVSATGLGVGTQRRQSA